MSNVKKGDLVVITDGSYARSVVNGKLIKELLNFGDVRGLEYVVIETDCSFPLEGGWTGQPEEHRNDTVIQGTEGLVQGKVVFIHHRFLRYVKHIIVLDGKSIEISHKSFLSLKKQLT